MRASDIPGLEKLTLEEKLALVEDILEQVPMEHLPVPRSHQRELDRRSGACNEELLGLEELKRQLGDSE